VTAPATTDAIWLVEEVVAVAQRLSAYWSIARVRNELVSLLEAGDEILQLRAPATK
jgi:hypothetical protein